MRLALDPMLGYRFIVVFYPGGELINPIDIRFQKVGGLSATVQTKDFPEGGQNLYTQKFPTGVSYDNLVLERGMVVGSLLASEFETTMSQFEFSPSNVLVTLMNELAIPMAAWLFLKAYPVKWATADLDATQKNVAIETMELTFSQMQIMRI